VARFGLKRWWQTRHPGPWRVGLVVPEADQVPEEIPTGEATLVASGGFRKWLAFDCPCGTGHRVMLNLDRGRWPFWTVFDDHPLTVSPSVDMETPARRCHYSLYYGHVNWVRGVNDWHEHHSFGRSRRAR
jgi:Family of unknown function (DUF6527)